MRTMLHVMIAILVIGSFTYAQSISPSEVVNDWIDTGEPRGGGNTGAWNVSGSEAQAPDHGMRLSDFTLDGGSFSGSFRTTGGDDDQIGFVFGFQDQSNHYRFAWDAFDSNNGHNDALGTNGVANSAGLSGGPSGSIGAGGGVHGIRLLKEVGGVNTYLYQDPGPSDARR